MKTDRASYRILDSEALLAAVGRDEGVAQLVVMSADETTHQMVMLRGDDELPACACGWSLQASAIFTVAQAHRFPADKVAATTGDDTLLVELLADAAPIQKLAADLDAFDADGFKVHPNIVMRGQVCAVEVGGRVEAAHISAVDAVGISSVCFVPNSSDRGEHPRLADGRRIAGVVCDGLAPQLLRFLATRRPPQAAPASIIRLPSIMSNFLPNTPTVGEGRRLGKKRRSRSFEEICAEICAERVPVAVVVKLDDESMRLAASTRSRRRQSALQLRLPLPERASNAAELQAAVNGLLQHFDTDYMLTYDAVIATLAEAGMRGVHEGVLLDDMLQRQVVALRFGSTNAANRSQRDRIARHFDMLRQIRVEVTPHGSRQTFRGAILVKVGEVVTTDGRIEPLKVGDAVLLNPVLYGDLRNGKGIFADARYLQLDAYRQDWHLRLYRYLAHRWSAGSATLAAGGWTLRQRLHSVLDGAGIEWRTKAHGQDRGELQARRRLDGVLADLVAEGMIGGASRIVGDGLAADAELVVEVPDAMRQAIETRRPGLHADAAAGTIQAPRKQRRRTPAKA